ncbi:unnamed protein product [Brassica oleracea var. botrytis]
MSDHVALSLAFDPSESPHYKVFCLGKTSNSSVLCHLEVYSSNEVHWFGPNSRDCLSFDVKREAIKTLPLPSLDHQDDEDPPDDVGTLRFMDESRGNLYFIEVNDQSSSDLSVYEMERNGSSWSLKYHVDLEPVAAAFPEMIITEYYTYRWIYAFTVIGFVKEEIDAEPYIVLHIPNKAVKYNFINKTFKKLCSFEPSQDDGVDNFYGSRRSFKFIESLANV